MADTPRAEPPAQDAEPPAPDAQPATPDGPEAAAPAAGIVVTEAQLRLAEALIFAAAEPVPARALVQALPDGADADAVLAGLAERYAGRGVELVQTAGGWQFRTATDLAPALTRVIPQPRRLPRAAMETLAIIAYHQPVTRAEIEEIRGASVSQATLDALLEAGLVGPRGRRETPGRPALWGTTANFLAQFQLQSLRDLPRREELLVEMPNASNAEVAAAAPESAAQAPDPAAQEGETMPPEAEPEAPQTPQPEPHS
ncbi:MAG: SMC-Scp complex subunit ScpB [Rhodospirillales bacterium]|nr:SMC-Scp complex subunit ScpB [Rhodospirillales bacterium]